MTWSFDNFSAAVSVESRKTRASRTAIASGTILVTGVAALSGSFAVAARAGNETVLAKLGPVAALGGWPGFLASSQQITAAGSVLAFGVVLSWMLGREFSDGTITGLFALPVSKPAIALAKLVVFLGWAGIVSLLLTGVLATLGLALGFGWPDTADLAGLGRLLVLAALSALIAVPAAFAATLGRGLLTGIAVMVVIIATTQAMVIAGTGPWFPFSAPALWAMAPETVPVAALALVAVVPLLFGALTLRAWARLQLDR